MAHPRDKDAASPADPLIELAAVTRAQGLRGEVQLKLFNPDSDLLHGLAEVVLRDAEGRCETRAVRRVHRHGKATVLGLVGVDDRDAAEGLRGALVCVRRSDLPVPEPGEYYFVDLIGLQVFEQDGEALGEVLDVLEYPSVECLVIERGGARWEVPVLDRYVLEVDVQANKVLLGNLAELEDLQPKPREG